MRKILNEIALAKSAMDSIDQFHTEYITEAEKSIQENKYVIIGMRQNPLVSKAQKALETAGIKYKYIEHGSYFSMWKPRLALKLWSGWPTFPMVFIDGKLIGGCNELLKTLNQNKN